MTTFDLLLSGDCWDADRGRLSDRWLAIDDGHIAGCYREKPGNATIERSVSLITPGLIDMHVHLVWDGSADPVATLQSESEQALVIRAIENAHTQLRHGVTTVRDVGSVADIAITVGMAIRQGRLAGPRTFASGRTVIITAGHDPFWGLMSDGPEACRKAVRELRGAGADLIKVSATGGVYGQAVGEAPGATEFTRDELEAIVDEAARFDLPVAAHAVGQEGIENAVAVGVDTIEHGNLMADHTLDQLIEADIAYDPTLYVYRDIANSETAPAYARANAQTVFERHWDVVRQAIAEDARIIAGSDAGSPGTPHPSLHRELACLVEAGMDEMAVLTAATRTAAAELGRPELGTLETGTPADVLGFDDDPLTHITATASPTVVVQAGDPVFGPEL